MVKRSIVYVYRVYWKYICLRGSSIAFNFISGFLGKKIQWNPCKPALHQTCRTHYISRFVMKYTCLIFWLEILQCFVSVRACACYHGVLTYHFRAEFEA